MDFGQDRSGSLETIKQSGKLRMALIGAGNFGVELAQYVNEVAEIIAVCDPSAAALTHFAKTSGLDIPGYQETAPLFTEMRFDAVVITTPHHTHRQITVDAARAGKHVYCEKAMANTVPECWEMIRACAEADVRLMVGHKRRLRPPWARMIELREQLGPVIAINACAYYDSRPYNYGGWWTRCKQSGGTLSLNGVHHIDWMRAMAGDVTSVRAIAAPQVDLRFDFPDTMQLSLTFQSSAIGMLDTSLSFPLLAFREAGGPFVIYKNGGVRCTPFKDHIDLHWQHHDDDQARLERFDDLGFDHAFRRELTDFVHWISNGTQPCLTWEEGIRCVEVMEAVRRSAEEGGTVIQLPLYPELENR